MLRWFCFGVAILLVAGVVSTAHASQYNAGATALWNDSSGRAHVAIGYSAGATGQAAVNGAIAQCEKMGGQSCRVLGPYDSGCFYLTVGNRTGGTTWGSGATREEAMQKCQEGGYVCDPPIGGCVGP
jgi:hypothetical protein